MPTSPTPIDALPATPNPDDAAGFDAEAYNWSAALPTFRTQTNAAATNVYNNATEATTAATNAATSEGNALTYKNAAGVSASNAGTSETNAATSAAAALASKNAAGTSETNANASKLAAASSASAAAAAAASIGYSDVVFLTVANSPYTVAQATSGKLLACDTSGGAIVVNLPAIAGLTTPYVVGVKKTTSDANSVTINRGSTDTFDDASTSKALTTQAGFTLIPDVDTAPDVWVAIAFGGMNAGPATSSGLTMSTGKLLGRSTAGTGAIEELDMSAVSPAAVRTPVNSSPADAATDIGETPALTGSTYYSLYGIAMSAGQWQVATDSAFASLVVNTGDVAGTAVSYSVSAGVLAVSTQYYWRCRYKDSEGTYSAWSAGTGFTTKADFNDYIAAPTATPANFGDPLEGGFYAGMIWNELMESATSTTIGTGSKTFAVPSMSATPLVYAGQTLEVRSRANPANKMAGTVTAAKGTSLTLNVTSVGGAGTFTDWSVMARYRVIVAPKASGENASIAYKNANTAAPTACQTISEGRKATLAMVGADTSTVYPAAWWCSGLNIGARTDWYLPARDELELCWRNLKPTTDANYATADRGTGYGAGYATLGSYGDTSTAHGNNPNSAPAGAAYTGGVPSQTAATAFRTGGTEAFEYGTADYWSASEYSAAGSWVQGWRSSGPGSQVNGSKTGAYRARAVRRSII